ncbi:MAG TPA: WhiB family transcriptional regulator [Candidatus Dormibacteraeota bacterium]|nr:WhiB family transcriptional regulator [Candidatus Dormibacteraeota bacterium]
MSTSQGRIARADSALRREAGVPPFEDAMDLACRVEGVDPEIFSATEGPRVEAAKSVCRSCNHRDACLAWAVRTDQKHDTWGGKTRAERVAMARPRPVVHLIAPDQPASSCCDRSPGELPYADGHRLTADRNRATCPALSTDAAEHLELP